MNISNQVPKLAGRGERIVNVIVDTVVFLLLWILLNALLTLSGLIVSYTNDAGERKPVIPLLTLLPTYWSYYVFAEYRYQRSVGKLVTKTRLVSQSGEKPTFVQVLIRTISRHIPFEYLSYLVTVEGIHDKLSKTRVVKQS